jgi:TrmH family RNA methyltransferase
MPRSGAVRAVIRAERPRPEHDLSRRMGTSELISPRSARVSAARRLLRRNFRAKDRRFLAEGPQAVREAVAHRPAYTGADEENGPALVELFATPEAAGRHPDILEEARRSGARVHLADPQTLESVAQTVSPQGLVGVCRFVDSPLRTVLAARPRLVAVLAHVRDPGNAGTVLRCADAAGADAVLLTDASVDLYNPKTVRASAGSLFHLPVVVGVPVEEAAAGLRAAGVRLLAADGNGERDLDDELDAGTMDGPTGWIFGNEAWGLPEETRALTDEVVRVPIHGRAESLNLATAAAVCLYASARAQRAGARGDGA